MRKSVQKLLAALLCASASYAMAGTTNKTFLMPRDPATDLAMDFTTWHKMRNAHYDDDKKKWGARFFTTAYYKESNNESSTGKYFGRTVDTTVNTDDCKKDNDFIGVIASEDENEFRLFPQDVLHDAANQNAFDDPAVNPLKDDIQFRPHQEMWGLTIGYHQILDGLLEGLFFFIKFPIAFVEHDLNAKSIGDNTPQKTEGGNGSEVTFFDILSGNVSQVNDPNKQAALKFAKIRGLEKCDTDGKKSRSDDDNETELAGIRFSLGYNFIYEEDSHLGLTLDVLFPTGDSPNGEFLWEAVASNGGHWELGATLDGHYEWEFGDVLFSVNSAVNYMYVFEDSEMRTLGFKRKNGNLVNWGHYIVGGQTGENQLFPLANVLTRKVDVEPGSKVDAYLAFALTYADWTFDLGYEFFWKDTEDVSLKCNKKDAWKDDTYAVANFGFDTGGDPFDATSSEDGFPGSGIETDNPAIQTLDIDTSVAETPDVTSHKIFLGVGYNFSEWDNPLMLGAGFHYEFAGERGILETWALWIKLGLAV